MASAISINIGLNHVDNSAYPDLEIPTLAACVNDARSMQELADSLGYVTTLLCDEEATGDRVIGELGQAALNLDPGGILLLSYSGHGSQMQDMNGDEPDGLDETWVLYDRQLIDDELYNMWSQFGRDTRIVVLSDSCHSGSVSRRIEYRDLAQSGTMGRHYRAGGAARFRSITQQASLRDFKRNKTRYTALQFAAGSRKRAAGMEASVLLISGCQDNQLSSDGDVNGLFTGTLLEVWAGGAFAGDYRAFHKAILQKMPATQTPNYLIVGREDPAMEAQAPFTVEAPSGGGEAPVPAPEPQPAEQPDIDGPPTAQRAGPPPRFQVRVGPGRYYAVELAAESSLFDTSDPAHERNDENFYASWSDGPLMQDAVYPLPEQVWDRLRNDERLYYRVLTSTRPDAWEDYEASNRDTDGEAIPALLVEG
jgi:hypothetical protein